MKIKEIEKNARPREKAIYFGVDSLTNVELIALLLGNGTKKYDVLKIAEDLLKKSAGLSRIMDMGYRDLRQIKGIGKAQALRILACFTIVKRSLTPKEGMIVRSPDSLVDYLKMEIGASNQECFYCVFLDKKRQICGLRKCFVGNLQECSVDQNAIFKEALQLGAYGIILVHNHPSGNLQPSSADFQLTQKFMQGGSILGIQIIDHIIVTNNSFYSMASRKVDKDLDIIDIS